MVQETKVLHLTYLHFAKEFDKVDHGVLLHKLIKIFITGQLDISFYTNGNQAMVA